ncbi:5-(carboxyamino)imidazole ribonucleotide mutase [Thermodesulforhabdus norvegica]|uniref:N5-carboxyaminoimidazole ribonucleotide mutase n=1 Tax=Thermodesulforhabdus norvegica TaxID=39841 RepID=A0A1I4UYR2_9BACT|nr:5-(carboxyamino)imidazole ribonucleotide mutase [Thermodesulforhabdus norvegica]SFM94015.1 5-(carboxyamino)imidazole ribonucleotide mutase [Thermodesulforhabdus norvegica]
MEPRVAVVMGSKSDLEVMQEAIEVLKEFGVPHEVRILSAHRVPDDVADFSEKAASRGIRVVIAGAGWAAHLAGSIAARTVLPVIGVPVDSSPLKGWDALLSTVQMPPGIPVATVSVGKGGARNAAYLAIEILALTDENLQRKLTAFREEIREKVRRADRELQKNHEAG